jgi:hypothetical protein
VIIPVFVKEKLLTLLEHLRSFLRRVGGFSSTKTGMISGALEG